MEMPIWLYAIIVLGGLGGYYWYTVGRHGGQEGYMKHKFGLKEGETLIHTFGASHIPEKSLKKDIGLMMVGMHRVGKTMTIGITNQNRLILSHTQESDGLISLERDQVKNIEKKGDLKIQKRSIVEIHLVDGNTLNLHINPDGVGPLMTWAG